jgi:hypothetical protein
MRAVDVVPTDLTTATAGAVATPKLSTAMTRATQRPFQPQPMSLTRLGLWRSVAPNRCDEQHSWRNKVFVCDFTQTRSICAEGQSIASRMILVAMAKRRKFTRHARSAPTT